MHYTVCFSFGDDTIGLIEFYNFNLEMNLVLDKTCLEHDDLKNDEIGVKLFWNV